LLVAVVAVVELQVLLLGGLTQVVAEVEVELFGKLLLLLLVLLTQ
jgi:hypothetical protein